MNSVVALQALGFLLGKLLITTLYIVAVLSGIVLVFPLVFWLVYASRSVPATFAVVEVFLVATAVAYLFFLGRAILTEKARSRMYKPDVWLPLLLLLPFVWYFVIAAFMALGG